MATATSKAIGKFLATARRSADLLKAHTEIVVALHKQSGKKPPSLIIDDLARSSVVLSVAAMDAYFTDVFAETLVPILKKQGATKGLAVLLEEAGFDTEQALNTLTMKRPYRRIRTIIDNYFEKYVTQRFERIDKLFLSYGFKDFSNRVQRSIGRRNMVRRVEKLVQRRHDIVHDGDMNSRGCLQPVDVTEFITRISDLIDFVRAADKMIMSKLK